MILENPMAFLIARRNGIAPHLSCFYNFVVEYSVIQYGSACRISRLLL